MTQQLFEPIQIIWDFVVTYWLVFQWLAIFIIAVVLVNIFKQTWLFYKQAAFKNSIEWTLLEIKIPRQVEKTPRAMEQFLMNIHGLRNAADDFLEKYIEGEVTLWWSLEMVSFGGEIHFYIRTPKKHAKMVSAALYAQYPTVEVSDVEDYMNGFPSETNEIYQKGGDIFGSEFVLRKEDVYPITTYEVFEKYKDELAMDPISALLEILAGVQKEEKVFLQILIRPAGPEYQEMAKKFIDKLFGREEKKEAGGSDLGEFLRNIVLAPKEHPTWGEKKEAKEEKDLYKKLTPGEQDLIKTIERNISKPSFETLIRVFYHAPISIFNVNFARRGILGAINQYSSPVFNSFRSNYLAETRVRWINWPHLFVKKRVEARKQRILYNYRNRKMPEETSAGKLYTSHVFDFNTKSSVFVLSTAELATIYHVPAEQVLTAPHVKRVESKKMGPPAGLPIFANESEDEKN